MKEISTLADELKRIKEKRGISLEFMAREIKVSLQTVHRLITGKTSYPNELTVTAFEAWIDRNKKYLS